MKKLELDPASLQPREKAMTLGVKALSDTELMAILFGTGTQGKNVLELCRDILQAKEGHLSLVARMHWRQFISDFKGVGPAKALTLLAALELGARANRDAMTMIHTCIDTSQKAYDYMLPEFLNLDHEEFWVLLLNNSSRPIKKVRVGQGGINSTMADARVILREALLAGAPAMIAFHNHPSGTTKPSVQDVGLTRRLREAAATMEIRLLDHIIVTEGAFYSFNDNGTMP